MRAQVGRYVGRLTDDTRGLLRDSSILGVGSAANALGQVAQIALITHVLGLRQYGVLAITIALVALVGRFLDFQVGETVIAFGSERLGTDFRTLAGIAQFGYVIDFLAGIVAFALVVMLAPFAGDLAGPAGTQLAVLYALTLLAATVDTTTFALLQLFGRFGTILRLVILREVLRILSLIVVLVFFGTLVSVVLALVFVEVVTGSFAVAAVTVAFRLDSGQPLWAPALASTQSIRRALFGMTFHTNVIGSVKLAATQGPTLIVGGFAGPLEAGIYKVGTAAAAGVGLFSQPLLSAALPRFARLLREGRTHALQRLVVQSTTLAAGGLGFIALIAGLFRGEILTLVGSEDATSAGTVFVLAVVAQFVGGVTFWNTTLLYAAKLAHVASKLYIAGAVFSLPLVVALAAAAGADGAAFARMIGSIAGNAAQSAVAVRLVLRDHQGRRDLPSRATSR